MSADYAGDAAGAARPAAQRAAEARYIDDWTHRVEDYGNRVHPAPPELDGQLRIRVVIGRDGQVRRAEVIQSSGHSELDQAALDTVHGAAPYRPFDAGMGELDSLSITRIWRFGEGNDYGVR
nr:TonB family protein [Halomonas getboli]